MIQTFGLGTIALFAAAIVSCAGVGPAIMPTGEPPDPVDTPAEARAIVVAAYPELAGHRLVGDGAPGSQGPVIGRPGGIGGRVSLVLAVIEPEGIVLSFISGSGDCPSGCTDERIDTFLVTPDGKVSRAAPLATPLGIELGRNR